MNCLMQTLCFLACAHSMLYGEELLTTKNSTIAHDQELLKKLKITSMSLATSPNPLQKVTNDENKLEHINVAVKTV